MIQDAAGNLYSTTSSGGANGGGGANIGGTVFKLFAVQGTATALKSSQNPTLLEESVTFTATVSATSGTPAGTITFYDGTIQLGSETLNSGGEAAYSTSTLAAGTHKIKAAYAGDSQFKASSKTITQKVEETTTTKLTYSPDPPQAGKAVTFTATVTATSGTPTGSVKFYNGATLLDTAMLNSSGVATYSTSTLTAGKHTIKATYVATAPFKASSASVALIIP